MTAQKVCVAMSGGVDSSVAAALLKEQGYEVYGVFMKTWSPAGIPCKTRDDRLMAARAAAHLGIPFAVWDFTAEYKRTVVDYMIAAYAAGRTPNPDVMCNKHIKFGLFLQKALGQGADFIATGHYVQLKSQKLKVKTTDQNSKAHASCFMLHAARDQNKDQSYFLWTLTQDQLTYCLFPIGDYEKPRVRAIAREYQLPNWDKKDSQGVCFVGQFDISDFLRAFIPPKEGLVLTTAGVKIGDHDGAQFVTIGQRHGLHLRSKNHEARITGIANTKAHYVVEKNVATNTIVVAEDDDPMLYRKKIAVTNINWISGSEPRLPMRCLARIRYRQPLQEAVIESRSTNHEAQKEKVSSIILDSCFVIRFAEPQRAVASGQSVVCYSKKGEMIGGGIIV